MRIELDNANLTTDIAEMLQEIQNVTVKEQKSFLQSCGDIIKSNVVRNMKRSKNNKSDYIHMADDVQVKIKKSKYGDMYMSVEGGSKTGYKWRFLNDGAIDQRGNVLNQADHFVEKSIEDSNSAIEAEINKFLEKVVK